MRRASIDRVNAKYRGTARTSAIGVPLSVGAPLNVGTVVTGPPVFRSSIHGAVGGVAPIGGVITGGLRRSAAVVSRPVYETVQNPPVYEVVTTPPKVYEIITPIVEVTPDTVQTNVKVRSFLFRQLCNLQLPEGMIVDLREVQLALGGVGFCSDFCS